MASKTYPEALLRAPGTIVDIQTEQPLPNYTGTVLANLDGRIYCLWKFLDGHWAVINPGGEIVQSALDRFLAEHAN
jgi:hypothetical protein